MSRPTSDIVSTYFSYYLYQIAHDHPQMPWHHVVSQAQVAVRDMDGSQLVELSQRLKLDDQYPSYASLKAKSRFIDKPFKNFFYWGEFVVLGQVQRIR